MFDITPVLEALFALALALVTAFVIPWIQERKKTEKIARILGIARQVVYAAWELDITGELIDMGLTKVEYAWTECKKILAEHKIAVNDDELKAYIKSEVAKLRINRGDEIVEAQE